MELNRRTGSPANSPEQQFRAVSRELDEALWRLLLRPPNESGLGVLQLGAVVEIMPNVYVQAVRLMHKEPYDRYVRLWCVVPTDDGELEERTLLCFYTQGFPDAQFTQTRPGMDLNTAWWDAVRARLQEVAAELGVQAELGPGNSGNGGADGALLPRAVGVPGVSGVSTRTTGSTFPAYRTEPAASATTINRADAQLREALALFEEVKRSRDEALKKRDEIDQQLSRLYFNAYPYMRQALRQLSEVDVGELIAKWARAGCPAPQPEDDQPAAEVAQPPASSLDGAWALALDLENAQARLGERTHMTERLCELSGGHSPMPRRDGATGRLQTICERCDAQLFHRESDARDGWIN